MLRSVAVLSGRRKIEVELAALAGCAPQPDVSAMGDHDFLGNGETKSDTSRLFGPGYPKEPFKKAGLKLLRDTGPVIQHRETNALANRFHRQNNFVASLREPCRVRNKIREYMAYLARIYRDLRKVGRNVQHQSGVVAFQQQFQVRQRVFYQLGRRNYFKPLSCLPGFQASEVQQIVDHPQQTFGVFARSEQEFELLGIECTYLLLQQQVKPHTNARQRGLQFVADCRDQVRLDLIHETEPSYVL